MKKTFLLPLLSLVTGGALLAQTPAKSLVGKKVSVYLTDSLSGSRMKMEQTLTFAAKGQPEEGETCVFVDPGQKFQTFIGIGAALTDASAETFAKLPAAKQEEVLTAYFSPTKGIGYTLARTNIHSCDFSSGSYTYVQDNDTELKTFSIEHDRQYRIPFIKKAIAAAGGKLTMFVSPWSPPAWMKDNNDILHGGTLLPKFYQSWANYYPKFIKAYEAEGIPVWGLTIQNEPMAKQIWESCKYTAEQERDFLKNYLGPTMQKAGLSSKKIIVWDHNRDLMYQRAQTIFDDPAAAKYAWGMGFHWYENWSGGQQMFDNVRQVKERYPTKNLIFTEGCAESFNAARYRIWSLGEQYGRNMINDFNNGTVAWTDWNILLDETGGPNHVGNFCFAPLHGDTRSGELIYTSAYYYIGHFSKFIRPGAQRIHSVPSRSILQSTAFVNTDGKTAVVVMNSTNASSDFLLWTNEASVSVNAPAHSILTLVY